MEKPMTAYDDVKRGLQEFVAPDLSDIKARLSAVEARLGGVETRLSAVEQAARDSDRRSEERDKEIMRSSEERDKELLRTMERGFDKIDSLLINLSRQLRTEDELRDVLQRLTALEAKAKQHSETAQ